MFDPTDPPSSQATEPPPDGEAAEDPPVLQLRDQQAVQDVEAWLVEWDAENDDAEARWARRLLADHELLLQLQLDGFEGPRWDLFSDALARYGYPILRSWIWDGSIWRRVREKYRPRQIKLRPRQFEGVRGREDADELAINVVGEGLVNFRSYVLLGGRWDPRGGASLRTYFVGNCLLRFPTIYSRWLREEDDDLRLVEAVDDRSHELGPARFALSRAELEEVLDQASNERERRVMALTAVGYEQSDIANELGISRKAVESIVARFRRRQAG
jgi:hypothetical protein